MKDIDLIQAEIALKQKAAHREEELSGKVLEINGRWKTELENMLTTITNSLSLLTRIESKVDKETYNELVAMAQNLMQSQSKLVDVLKESKAFEKDCDRVFGESITDLKDSVNELSSAVNN